MDSRGRSCYSSYSTTLIEAALAGKPIHRFSPEPFPAALESEWHSLVPVLKDREAFLGAMRQTPIKPTGEPLADWARTRFFPVGDPFNAIAEAIARFYAAAAPHTRPSVPDHKCCGGDGLPSNIFANESSACQCWSGTQGLQLRHPQAGSGYFWCRRCGETISRWQQVLNASTCAKSTEQNRAPICTG